MESGLRFNVGARIYLDEIVENYNITKTAALFSETQARILVSVGREDDVKFVGLCEQRNIPITRIGGTDSTPTLEIHNLATWQLTELKSALDATLPELFN